MEKEKVLSDQQMEAVVGGMHDGRASGTCPFCNEPFSWGSVVSVIWNKEHSCGARIYRNGYDLKAVKDGETRYFDDLVWSDN